MKILHIDTSLRQDRSVSRELTRYTVDLISKGANMEIDRLDLNMDTPNSITQAFLDAHRTPEDDLTLEQQRSLSESNSLIARLRSANLYVIGLPMYNFTFPSCFKTFLDNVMISGKTFKSDANGDVGLLTGKKAVVISSRGGTYDTPDTAQYDCLTPLVHTTLGYIGIQIIHLFKVEATVFFGEERKNRSIAKARKEIRMMVDQLKSRQQ